MSTQERSPDLTACFSVIDLASLTDMLRLRRSARKLRGRAGLRYLRLLGSVGSRRGYGLRPGIPDPRCVALLTIWDSPAALDMFRSSDPMHSLVRGGRQSWSVYLRPYLARGSIAGASPLAGVSDPRARRGPIAVLTLGRTSPRRLYRFI